MPPVFAREVSNVRRRYVWWSCTARAVAAVMGSCVIAALLAVTADALTGGTRSGLLGYHALSRGDIALREAKQYAYDAYPSWAAAHPDHDCPSSLGELTDYMNQKGELDPWGRPFQFGCDRGLWVRSLGEDGVLGTEDDVRSDR